MVDDAGAKPAPDAPAAVAQTGAVARLRALISPWGPPLKPGSLSRRQKRNPFFAGSFAAGAALNVAVVLRMAGVGVFLPEAAVEWVVDNVPGWLESGAISFMGGFAKIFAVALAVVAFVVILGLAGSYYPRFDAILWSRRKLVALFFAGPAVVTLVVALPFFGDGFFGDRASGGAAAAVASTLATSAVYAAVLDLAYREFQRKYPQGVEFTRRTLIQAVAAALVIGIIGMLAIGANVVNTGRLGFSSVAALFTGEVTPNGTFYVVQKNLSSPTVNPSSWSLSVDGLVDRPMELSSNDLLARPQTEEVVTLECISNQVGGALISNARWSGVPLSSLLAEAGVKAAATWVLFTCADAYTVGVPLLRATAPGSLLALHMNGERLPRDHGFPLRVLVPGLYGMMNAKWLSRITLVDHEVEGYWQVKGWSNEASIRASAFLAVAPATAAVGQAASLGGVAFAGDRQITRVEVSDDGGSTWNAAALKAPLSPYAWTLWTYDWTPRAVGHIRLSVRATELRGGVEVVQESLSAGPFPRGAAGYDSVEIRVA